MEYFDRRGGSNKYKINFDFFKKWSHEMAYVLGFLYADGNIGDSANSSRTNYISFSSKDRDIIEAIRLAMKSDHSILRRGPRKTTFSDGRVVNCKETFCLRIGSRKMYIDLLKLGLVPRKSKVAILPSMPNSYFGSFVRGYFDGDGCVCLRTAIGKEKPVIVKQLNIIFTSGSKVFLTELNKKLSNDISVNPQRVYESKRAYQLKYCTSDSLQIFKAMYQSATGGLFLKRKIEIFNKYFKLRPERLDQRVLKILRFCQMAG